MHSLSIGLAVALGVCAIVVLELVRRLRRRTSRDVEEQVAATVETLEARLDELAQELGSAVRRAEEETQRARFLAQLGTTIDLDDAMASTLEAAAALPQVDAAVVELEPDPPRPDGPPQPPLLPRDARPRGRPRAAVSAPALARDRRRRRLQGDQRPDRPPGGRRRPRGDRRPHPAGRALRRRPVPGGR